MAVPILSILSISRRARHCRLELVENVNDRTVLANGDGEVALVVSLAVIQQFFATRIVGKRRQRRFANLGRLSEGLNDGGTGGLPGGDAVESGRVPRGLSCHRR